MPKYNNKITKTVNKVEIDFNKDIEKVPKSKRKSLLNIIADTIVSGIESETSKQTSPIVNKKGSDGRKFEKLSPEYATAKRLLVGNKKADLELSSSMKSSIKTEVKPRLGKIIVKITDKDEKKKSFNHNTGDTLPERKFLPVKKRDRFSNKIESKIEQLIKKSKNASNN